MNKLLAISIASATIAIGAIPAKALECPPGYVRAIVFTPTCVKKATDVPLTKEQEASLKREMQELMKTKP